MLDPSSPILTPDGLRWSPQTTTGPTNLILVRGLMTGLSDACSVRLKSASWLRASELEPGDDLYEPPHDLRLDPTERGPRPAGAFRAGLSLRRRKEREQIEPLVSTIYGVAPDPAMDHSDRTLYAPWLLGLTVLSARTNKKNGFRVRRSLPLQDQQLMALLGLAPVNEEGRTILSQARATLTYRVSTEVHSPAPRLKVSGVGRTEGPLTAYPPGEYRLPQFLVRIDP